MHGRSEGSDTLHQLKYSSRPCSLLGADLLGSDSELPLFGCAVRLAEGPQELVRSKEENIYSPHSVNNNLCLQHFWEPGECQEGQEELSFALKCAHSLPSEVASELLRKRNSKQNSLI